MNKATCTSAVLKYSD